MLDIFTPMNWLALGFFISVWLALEYLIDYSPLKAKGLTALMSEQRAQWMHAVAHRELRMIDTQILIGQQHGATYFASACLLATGASISMLGATDSVLQIYRDLAMPEAVNRQFWEIRVLGLSLILVYAFFKFAWAHRLFSYCGILVGAIPNPKESTFELMESASKAAAEINILAGVHFTAGLRAIFFSFAYLGWFISDLALAISTLFILWVLVRRQYFSKARAAVLEKQKFLDSLGKK